MFLITIVLFWFYSLICLTFQLRMLAPRNCQQVRLQLLPLASSLAIHQWQEGWPPAVTFEMLCHLRYLCLKSKILLPTACIYCVHTHTLYYKIFGYCNPKTKDVFVTYQHSQHNMYSVLAVYSYILTWSKVDTATTEVSKSLRQRRALCIGLMHQPLALRDQFSTNGWHDMSQWSRTRYGKLWIWLFLLQNPRRTLLKPSKIY